MVHTSHEHPAPPARMPVSEDSSTVATLHAVPLPKLEGEVGPANAAAEAALVAQELRLTTKIDRIDRELGTAFDENQRMTLRKIQSGFRDLRQAIGLIRGEIRLIEKRQQFVDAQTAMLLEDSDE